MLGGAIGALDHEVLARQGLTLLEGLHGGVVVVEVVGPVAVGIQAEGAVGALDLVLGLEAGLALIDIGGDQLAAGGEGHIFFDRALVSTRGGDADAGVVVGAGDGDGDRRRGTLVAIGIGGNIGKGNLLGFPFFKGLELCRGGINIASVGI